MGTHADWKWGTGKTYFTQMDYQKKIILTSDKKDIQIKTITRVKEEHSIMIKQSIQEDITIISSLPSLVTSDSLRIHELQHASLPCPTPAPRAHPNSWPLSRWCHPTISFSVFHSPPALNLSQHQDLFKWGSSLHQVAKIWSFSFNISPSNKHPGLISFRMD